mmetsp:Transcript_17044/g.39390  ORF Transcript_17044/g.39390 Transcript_17044/m.39390 type:complete len:200 (+) Transcript_17044:2143-2742(+)
MMIPASVLKPSISTSSELSVFSLSSLVPGICPRPLDLPIASISSIKIIQGALLLALLNRSLTRAAPTPTNISTKSDPDKEKNATLASPATALANKVFPVPGGPINKAPLGIFPPSLVNFAGFLRNSTISMTSSLASCRPAISSKVTFTLLSASKRDAFDFPMLNICPPGPPADVLRIKNQNPKSSRNKKPQLSKKLVIS